MLKKRLIFTLLYNDGDFVLSRNFRLQSVGTLDWLRQNYNFEHVAFFIDELIVLDVSRNQRDIKKFSETLKLLSDGCFVPIAAGGGVRTKEQAKCLLRSGADKVVLNSCLFESPTTVKAISNEFGQQCLVGSLDARKTNSNGYEFLIENGQKAVTTSLKEQPFIYDNLIGEIYLNSVDQDGTGQGYDMNMLSILPNDLEIPIIIAGGVGNAQHLSEGLDDERVGAVATANLYNFVGNGLKVARQALRDEGKNLAAWPVQAKL